MTQRQKRTINFSDGPTLEDLGINVVEDSNTKSSHSKNRDSRNRLSNNRDSENEVSKTRQIVTAESKAVNRGLHQLIREYLYSALGNNAQTELKLADMGKDLGITSGTLYKHLKILRETEFIITKLRYSTKIEKR